ncbi:hypothetical protein AAG906_039366 [Vitis piasezkii]
MNKAKVVSSPLATHFRLSTNQSPSIDQEKKKLKKFHMPLQYFQGTSSMSLCFGCEKLEFIGYTDANMAGDIDSFRINDNESDMLTKSLPREKIEAYRLIVELANSSI